MKQLVFAGSCWIKAKDSFLVDHSSEHKKPSMWTKMLLSKNCYHNEYKDVLLNKKSMRHSMKRIQSKNLWNGKLWNEQNFIVLLWWINVYPEK